MTDSESAKAQPAPPPDTALPLEELELTPEWVKSSGKSHADHPGPEREPRRDGRGPGHGRDRERRPRPERPPGPEGHRGVRPERHRSGHHSGPGKDRVPKPSVPPAELVDVTFQPEEKGFEGMLETMKQTSRAYALFDVAKLVLNKPERHHVKLSRKAGADGTRPPLFLVLPSESVFLRQEDAARFALRHHGATIFKEKKTSIEPPKGNFTFVNRCGLTGVWLGPPNYHEYQSRLIRHHQQRLRHIPFAEFQSRIQTVKDPAAVKAWVDSMSVKMEYECLLDPEPKSFASREELEKHFLENHLGQFVTSGPELRISGVASRQLQNPMLLEAVRLAWLEERKFPMKTANEMRGRFRHEGFHFFKDPRGITYVGRIKPQRFESIGHLSERIQKIIVYLREHFGCKRKHLIELLLPQLPAPTPPAEATAKTDPPVPAPATGPSAAVPPPTPSSSGQDQLLADLHWLIADGYVVEFSDGRLWALADKPPPPPPKPAPVSEPTPAPASESAPPMTVVPSENGSGPPVGPVAETTAPAPPAAPPAPAADGVEPNPGEPAAS
ncbi:MAG TPA: hypothetical protein VL486_01985 [Verrucomicrobiae bacterium]|nr:hypothetical protein [Verrucomicrobiae bacterium]